MGSNKPANWQRSSRAILFKPERDKGDGDVTMFLRGLDRLIGTVVAAAKWLAGDYSFADIAFYMAHVFADRKGAGMTDATPRLIAWRNRVRDRPAVHAVVDPMMKFLASEGRGVPAFLQR